MRASKSNNTEEREIDFLRTCPDQPLVDPGMGTGPDKVPTHQAVASNRRRSSQPGYFLCKQDSFEFTAYSGTSFGQFFLLWWVENISSIPHSPVSTEGGGFFTHRAKQSLGKRYPADRAQKERGKREGSRASAWLWVEGFLLVP